MLHGQHIHLPHHGIGIQLSKHTYQLHQQTSKASILMYNIALGDESPLHQHHIVTSHHLLHLLHPHLDHIFIISTNSCRPINIRYHRHLYHRNLHQRLQHYHRHQHQNQHHHQHNHQYRHQHRHQVSHQHRHHHQLQHLHRYHHHKATCINLFLYL